MKLAFGKEETQSLFAETGKPLPPVNATITGTGIGRWKDKAATVRWRVIAKDRTGKAIGESGFRNLRLTQTK